MAALAVAVRAPLDVVVFGILVAGTAHVAFELRFVIGRYLHRLGVRTFLVVSALLGLIVAGRLLAGGSWWPRAEVVVLGVVLLVAVATSLDVRARAVGGAAVVAWLAVAWTWPTVWPVAQAHLHNLLPAVFLWEWSRVLGRRDRRPLRALTLTWAVVVPVVILVGVADAVTAPGSSLAEALAAQTRAAGSAAPPGTGSMWAQRLLVLFAFLQLVHYVVWCWFVPRVGVAEQASFEATPVGAALRGRRFGALIVALTGLVVALAWSDVVQGRLVYTSLASYHAYLEYPVLIALVAAAGASRRRRRAAPVPQPDPEVIP